MYIFIVQWPPLVEVIDTRELPPVLVERYNAAGGEGTALCGIFPEIRRAWASVDNSLFLWRFDKWLEFFCISNLKCLYNTYIGVSLCFFVIS